MGVLVLAAPSSGAPPEAVSAGASVVNGVIAIDGRPFFPVMLLDQCGHDDAARAVRLGVNVVLNADCPGRPVDDQLAALGDVQLGVVPIRDRSTSGPQLLGWAYPDEPDDNGWSAESLAATFDYPPGSPDGLLSFVTTTARFFTGPDRDGASETVRDLAGIADVAGFDLYPLNHCNSSLRSVYDAQRLFARLAGAPTFQWIETGSIGAGYCGGFEITAEQLTAEAWLAVVGGARGIGFFTHTVSPTVSDLAVTEPVQQAIRRFADVAAAVDPGLTGTTVGAEVDTPAVVALARRGGGRTYVVAVNTLESAVPAVLTVPRVRGQVLRVVGENRTVPTRDARLADTFPPLGVHVYVTS